MFPVWAPDWLAGELRGFAKKAAVARLAGLLTLPQLHAHTLRLELLVHLAARHCAGEETPSHDDIQRWLNEGILETQAARMEDPVEDADQYFVGAQNGERQMEHEVV